MSGLDDVPREARGHAGLPVSVEEILVRVRSGLPVYCPTSPADIDQRPYRAYLRREADASQDRSSQG